MSHSSTERLIDYWRERKLGDAAPLRAAIDPSEIASLLPQVFILGCEPDGRRPFRLAGGFVTELHDRDLRKEDFLELWSPVNRSRLAQAIDASLERAEPLVALASGRAALLTLPLEIVLAPMIGPSGKPDRLLGLYQPLGLTSRLQGKPLDTLALLSLTGPGVAPAPRLKLAAVDGRRIA